MLFVYAHFVHKCSITSGGNNPHEVGEQVFLAFCTINGVAYFGYRSRYCGCCKHNVGF